MRSDRRDFNPAFLIAGMLKLPATRTTTIRSSQTRRWDAEAAVIGIHLQILNLSEEHGFSAGNLTNKPEIYMKVFANCIICRTSGAGFSLRGRVFARPNPRKLKLAPLQTIPLRSSSSG
jgi:hypothetical protein